MKVKKSNNLLLLRTDSNKSKFRFSQILLVSSFILFNSIISFSAPVSHIDQFVNPVDVEGNKIINSKNPPSDMDYALKLSVFSGVDYFTSGYIKNKVGEEKRGILVEYYKTLILLLQDLEFDVNEYPSYINGLDDKGSDKIEELINKGISEGYLYIQEKKELEKQRIFYSKFISLVKKMYKTEQFNMLGGVCQFMKANKKQSKLKKCKMPDDCYDNYDNTFNAVNDCLGKSLPFTCNDIFEYYPVNKLLALDSKPGMIIKNSVLNRNLYFGYNVSQFCPYSYINLFDFEEIIKKDYYLSEDEVKLYATKNFIEGCARQFMGNKIDEYCKNIDTKRLKKKNIEVAPSVGRESNMQKKYKFDK